MRAFIDVVGPLALVIASLVSAACGGSVITGSTGSGGAGGSGPGSGGAGASGGASGVGGAGGAPVLCGGFVGAPCPPGQWCDFPDGLCGGADGDGVCAPIPSACPGDCPGVCGCDNKFYCNACAAQAAGVDTADNVVCPQSTGEYSAEAVFGGLDHLMIFKADPIRNVCLITHLARPTMSAPEFMMSLPPEWGVVSASITNNAADCASAGMPPLDKSVGAVGATGSVTFNVLPGKFFPCDISIHGTLLFPPGEPWLSEKEALNADGVMVKNGCI